MNDIYDELKGQDLPIELVGIGKDSHISYSDNWTSGNHAPVCADESPFSTWSGWGASQRDLFVLNLEGNIALHQNISSGIPDGLEDLILDLLDPAIALCDLGTVYVSEVSNASESESYIEIYNSGSVDCSLEGYRLGNSDNPLDHTFGVVVIPAAGFWLGYQGQDSSFSADLDSSGDTIIFSDSNNNILSIVLGASQELNGVTLSQSFDSNGVGCYTDPTPEETNGVCVTLGNHEESILPEEVILYQNYPNPFNPVTTMKFSLWKDAYVNFNIYDLNGNLILNLLKGNLASGNRSIEWNGVDHFGQKVSAGIYVYRLEIDGIAYNKKMIYLK